MSFVSLAFALFVTIVICLYYIIPKKYQWIVLLVASYVFYFICSEKLIVYLLVTTISVFTCAKYISGSVKKQKEYIKANKELSKDEKKQIKAAFKKKQRWLLLLCVFINIGILAYLKYINWGIAYFNYYRLHWFGVVDFVNPINILMPLGISFYTFQSVGYIIDVYNGKYEAEENIFKFALYVSFFPQIIQGPISRFNELAPELYKEKAFNFYNIKSGLIRILYGLFKKLVIAQRVSPYVTSVMNFKDYGYDGFYILLAVFLYSMEIYCDFSGGIDIALGVAEMLDIKVAENFERPFFSKSIAEYWRRWHITLGTWFKDYIFYPLSICKPFLNLSKWLKKHFGDGVGKRAPLYLPLFIVWTTTGMWHGSESRFVVWGLLNFVFIILGTELEPVSEKLIEKFNVKVNGFWFKSYRILKTFWLMSFLRLFDISKNAKDAFHSFALIFRPWHSFNLNSVYETLGINHDNFIVVIIAIIILFISDLLARRGPIRHRVLAKNTFIQWVLVSALFVAVIVFGSYGLGYEASSFIYGNF